MFFSFIIIEFILPVISTIFCLKNIKINKIKGTGVNMAQNFLDKLLNLAGLNLSSTNNRPASIYRDEVGTEKLNNLSGVERYQRQKNRQEKLTSVDKYLAKKQDIIQEKTKVKDEIISQMTGVEKYLFKLNKDKESTTQSSVKKYIAKQKQTEEIVVIDNIEEVSVEVEIKRVDKTIIAEKNVDEDNAKVEQKATIEIETSEIINLARGATQCQATTLKESQCRRKNNLIAVEKMIDEQRYKFAICRQHDNDIFTPFQSLLKTTTT